MVLAKLCRCHEGANRRVGAEAATDAGDGWGLAVNATAGGPASVGSRSHLGRLLLSNNALHPPAAGAFLVVRG